MNNKVLQGQGRQTFALAKGFGIALTCTDGGNLVKVTSKIQRLALLIVFLGSVYQSIVLADPCEQRSFSVKNKTYQRLSSSDTLSDALLQNAYLWVDDIESKILGGWNPFKIYVVVGRIYPPFGSPTGKLARNDFERLITRDNVNNELFGPLQVPSQWQTTPKLTFKVGQSEFYLEVVQVQSVLVGDDSVEFRLCNQ